MKRILVISLITIAAVIGIWFLLVGNCGHGKIELALQAVCGSYQKQLYSALAKYHEEHAVLPSKLAVLVQQGYVSEEIIHCPTRTGSPSTRLYKYFPENFGSPGLVVISESVENHAGKGLRLSDNVQPVIIETMGDGTIKKRKN